MTLQAIYDQIIDLSTQLYKGDIQAYNDLKEFLNELNNVFTEVICHSEESKRNIIAEYIAVFMDAYDKRDDITLADNMYYEISELIRMEAAYQGIKVKAASDVPVLSQGVKRKICKENYTRNQEVVPDNKKELYQELFEYCDEFDEDDPDILIDEDCNIAVRKNESWWFLNSRYSSEHASEEWKQGKELKNFKSVQVVCGMSNGCYLRRICEMSTDEIAIVVYEPDPKVFAINMLYNDLTDIIARDNVIMCVEGINEEVYKEVLNRLIEFTTIKFSQIHTSPLYRTLYEEEIKAAIEQYKKVIILEIASNNTIIEKNEMYNNNMVANFQFLLESTTVITMKDLLKKKKIQGVPAILVAAGPSLDKNIEQLKAAKGKAFIMAVDSSIRMMLKHNIMPDVVVTLDPNKERELFQDERIREVPLMYVTVATHDVIKDWKGQKILYNNNYFTAEFMKLLDVSIGIDDAGGSVANAALMLAEKLGFKNIIMIGQDLAFTGNKKHASVVYEETDIREEEMGMYTYVDGINGEKLLTYHNFMIYKDQFENRIKANEELNVINATEGGALMKGTTNMTLKAAIDQYCGKKVDFGKIIKACDRLDQLFTKEDLLDALKKCITDCNYIVRKYKECEKLYKQLETETDAQVLTDLLSEIDKNIKRTKKRFVMELAEDFSKYDAVIEEENIYEQDEQENYENEKNEISKSGARISRSYVKSAKRAKKLFEQSIKELK